MLIIGPVLFFISSISGPVDFYNYALSYRPVFHLVEEVHPAIDLDHMLVTGEEVYSELLAIECEIRRETYQCIYNQPNLLQPCDEDFIKKRKELIQYSIKEYGSKLPIFHSNGTSSRVTYYKLWDILGNQFVYCMEVAEVNPHFDQRTCVLGNIEAFMLGMKCRQFLDSDWKIKIMENKALADELLENEVAEDNLSEVEMSEGEVAEDELEIQEDSPSGKEI